MTQPQPSATGAPPSKRDGLPWIRTILAGLLMLVVLAGAAGIWYIFFRGDGPPPVGTGAPLIPGAKTPAASAAPAATSSGTTTTVGGSPAAAIDLDGTWSVDPSIGSFDYDAGDFSGSWAGYRVQEQLVGVGGATAVGRTPDITGTFTFDGSTVTAADFTVNLTTLVSDQAQRDGQVARQGVQADQFPTATFKLAQPIDLGSVPAEGEQVSVTATGDLTLHGVTKSVQIPLTAKLTDDVIGVAGSYSFTWQDFGMEQPSSARVVSLADDVTLEFQAFLTKG